jgi:hypothetical protein
MLNKKAISELLKSDFTDLESAIDFHYIIDEVGTIDEMQEKISDYIQESCDIIYYSNAIEYLQKNDPSLRISLDIAQEYGFSFQNINSEVLASLLYKQELSELLAQFISDAEDIAELPDAEVEDETTKKAV